MATARDQIIDATRNLIELQGYYATGLNQIIKESGSPKGSLYYYFPGGKEELAAEAVNQAGQTVLQRIQDNMTSTADAADAVCGFIMNVAHYVELSGFRAGGPITTIAIETASASDRLREECDRIYAAWELEFANKLRADGFSIERAARLATLIIGALEGGIVLARTRRSREPLESVAQEIGLLIKASR